MIKKAEVHGLIIVVPDDLHYTITRDALDAILEDRPVSPNFYDGLKAQEVVDENEMKEDLVQDMIEVLTSFFARLYGSRSAKDRARKALKEIEKC